MPAPIDRAPATDDELEARYEQRGQKLVLETNREKLQNFYEALKRPGYMEIRPFYQRRPRWDAERQSQFIESFIINIPAPPLYLFETNLNAYEVIDGQQRITAIQDFFSDRLCLEGLVHWRDLNGRKYSTLPGQLRAGIERRSISYIVVLRESADNPEEALFIKQTLFERLNTGGVHLSAQEVRNSLYDSPFNRLIRELSEQSALRSIWYPQMVAEDDDAPTTPPEFLASMEDVELVLRFFALRHYEHFRGTIKQFLDLYMSRSRAFREDAIRFLKDLFLRTISLVNLVYQDRTFRDYRHDKGQWGRRPLKAVFDAEMIAFSEHIDHAEGLIAQREAIVAATEDLFTQEPRSSIVGRLNTPGDIRRRIELFRTLLGRFSGTA